MRCVASCRVLRVKVEDEVSKGGQLGFYISVRESSGPNFNSLINFIIKIIIIITRKGTENGAYVLPF